MPNTEQSRAIFKIWIMQAPSLCRFAPRGMEISAISLGIPISFACIIFTGRDAAEEQVPRAVRVGAAAPFHHTRTPSAPAPI